MKFDLTIPEQLMIYIHRKYGSHKAAGNHWGISGAYIGRILAGNAPPTDAMLEAIGYKRKITKTVEIMEVSCES